LITSKVMKVAAWITLFYGLIVIAGGIVGYLKAHSMASIVMGSIAGFLLLLSALGMMGKLASLAHLALIITFILDAFFTYRWVLSMKFMPSGVMSIISTIVLVILAVLVKNRSKI